MRRFRVFIVIPPGGGLDLLRRSAVKDERQLQGLSHGAQGNVKAT
jgi:hypothetical protein